MTQLEALASRSGDPRSDLDVPPPSGIVAEKSQWQDLPSAEASGRDPLLACLVTLSELNGRPTSGQAMLAGLPLPEDGLLTPALAVRAASRAGLVARLLPGQLEAIDTLALPAILLLRGGNACILVGRDQDGSLQLLLPETGRGVNSAAVADLTSRYAGWALFARPELVTEREERRSEQARPGHWFWRTVLAQWPIYAEVGLAAVLVNLFALASPLFVMNVYDRVIPHSAVETLWVLAIGALTVFGFDFLLRTLRGYFVDSAGRIADIKLASRIFEQVLGIRMAARPRFAGAFANQLREFESLRDVFASASVTTLVDLPFVFLFIGLVWIMGGPVALVPAIAVPVVIVTGLLLQLPLNAIVRRTLEEGTRKHAVLVETINGLETIKSVGGEGRMQRAWERYVAAAATSGNHSRLLSAVTVNLAGLAANAVTVGVVAVGVYEIAAGRMTVGALVACSILAGRAMAPLGQVAQLLSRLHQARVAYRTLDAVMRLPVERPVGTRFVHRPRLNGEIELRNVTFTYPGQKTPALNRVSFRIAPGERVAIIGRIGSGKTTVEKMVLGLYEPDSGSVLIDGTDLRQIDPADLRRNIGAVPQDVMLFAGTIRENITIGAPHADDAAMLRAAGLAGVDLFAGRHPAGYDRDVGERGQALSGGQRQAVALARALLVEPPILLLDEPTAAMDNAGETALKLRLGKMLAGRTLVLVTHRASLLNLVDRLIVLDGGAVVADGPKEEVMRALASGEIKGVV
jgi:ATP-binding cassette subfamily C protein LapB